MAGNSPTSPLPGVTRGGARQPPIGSLTSISVHSPIGSLSSVNGGLPEEPKYNNLHFTFFQEFGVFNAKVIEMKQQTQGLLQLLYVFCRFFWTCV